jgi:Zn-dependent M16 (insulinase) family peptidase
LDSDNAGLANFLPVRKYHSNYYVPHNLALIVSGKLHSGTASLLRDVQEQIEPSLISHGQNHGHSPSGWKRPFVETASAVRIPIPATTKHTVEFPEKDECTCFRCSIKISTQGKI